jgi:hypothetical protein
MVMYSIIFTGQRHSKWKIRKDDGMMFPIPEEQIVELQ